MGLDILEEIMIEMPEAVTIASQMNASLTGKTFLSFSRGSLTHKFLWLNRPDEEFSEIIPGLIVRNASSFGRSIYLNMRSHLLWWGDTGGKLLYSPPDETPTPKYHLSWHFQDGSTLTFKMQMWGSVKLLNKNEFNEIPHDEAGIPPLYPKFTFERFNQMLESYSEKNTKGVKGFLVATGYKEKDPINGLGNAIVQDILFNARLSPKRKIFDITLPERKILYEQINKTVAEAIEKGGRYDEYDLHNQQGGYHRLMDSKSVGKPCPNCDQPIIKISYLGGACYLCPQCQV
jgi:formamidopyrimidine-DNA glycosylase